MTERLQAPAGTYMSRAEAPSRSLMMSLVRSRVGPAGSRQRELSLSIGISVPLRVKPERENRRRPSNSAQTYCAEGVAELQVESVDGHLVAHGQDGHGGEVAGGVGDVGVGGHAGQAEGGPWKPRVGGALGRREGGTGRLRSAYLRRGRGPAASSPGSSGPAGGSAWSPPSMSRREASARRSGGRWRSRWAGRGRRTWGYCLLMFVRVPSGSFTSSVSLTAWTVVARGCLVKAST